MAKADLRIDWATHAAAKYACENWHYSGCMPAGKLVKVGAWESGKFIGVVLFGRGASPDLGKRFGTGQDKCVELVRIALRQHDVPVSRIMSLALRWLKNTNPQLRLVVSFADSEQGHHGGIYQSTNWIYTDSQPTHAYRVRGEMWHPKSLHSKYGKGGQSIPWLRANVDPKAERVISKIKHRYLMPLDAEMKARILPLAKPYPKRAKDQASESPSDLGGETPTRTLQGSDHVPQTA